VPLARHWYHSEHLLVDGKKMSKSDGTFHTLDDIVAKEHSPMVLRYALLTGHPRKQLNFTLDSLHAAESALKHLRAFQAGLGPETGDPAIFAPVFTALADDLNTPAALGALFTLVNRGPAGISSAGWQRVIFALGLDLSPPPVTTREIPAAITALAEKRWAAKQAKDWTTADALRAEITAAGWSMQDRKNGYDLEPTKP
jgi:cysteinyl-tRNA synthetase